jgi:hypothetical protein
MEEKTPGCCSLSNDGINAVRQLLDQAWIDETRCERRLNALRSYRREWSEKLQTFHDRPLHDASSQACDAPRTFVCGFRDPRDKVIMPASGGGRLPVYDVGRWRGGQ